MYLFYNATISFLFVSTLPYFLFRSIFAGRKRIGLKEKFGFISKGKRRALSGRTNIWLHAVSVGEILASLPLIKLIQQKFPNYQLVISTTTVTGQKVAREKVSQAAFIYFPFDIFWIAAKLLNIVKPAVFLAAESEIWPNFFKIAHKRNIPVIIFNGRISARSYGRYKIIRGIFRQVLSCVSLFGMQTERDAQRIAFLGGGLSSRRVKVTGNIKFDALPELTPLEIERIRKEMKLSSGDLIFAAGSTHPGEEEIVLRCFLELKKEFINLRLILCPRHLERLVEVESIIGRFGLSFARRTQLKESETELPDVFLLDTMGELAKIYSLAAVVFVGGSLVPKGGQNILEPVNFGKPAVFGPYIGNFQEIAGLLEQSGVGFRIQNEAELYQKVGHLLKEENLREKIKSEAGRIIDRHRGASARNFELIEGYLNDNGKSKA